MKAYLARISVSLVILLLSAACFGGGASKPNVSKPSTSEATTAPTAVPVAQATVTETTAPVATAETAPAANASLSAAFAVEDVPEVRTYRTLISVISESPRGFDGGIGDGCQPLYHCCPLHPRISPGLCGNDFAGPWL